MDANRLSFSVCLYDDGYVFLYIIILVYFYVDNIDFHVLKCWFSIFYLILFRILVYSTFNMMNELSFALVYVRNFDLEWSGCNRWHCEFSGSEIIWLKIFQFLSIHARKKVKRMMTVNFFGWILWKIHCQFTKIRFDKKNTLFCIK